MSRQRKVGQQINQHAMKTGLPPGACFDTAINIGRGSYLKYSGMLVSEIDVHYLKFRPKVGGCYVVSYIPEGIKYHVYTSGLTEIMPMLAAPEHSKAYEYRVGFEELAEDQVHFIRISGGPGPYSIRIDRRNV